jgi:hypothetical protein
MKTKITISAVLICLLVTPNILSVGQFTNAKTYTGYESLRQLPAITIASNGSVIPQNGIVQQVGNEYRLTRNLTDQYSIQIYCSNIIFDGQGNCLDGCGLSGSGLTLANVINSTVRNIVIRNFPQACISIDNSAENNFIGIQCDGLELYKSDNNNFSKSAMGLSMTSSSHNRFFNNNFSGSVCSVGLNYCSDNLFFDNNIEHLLCYYSSNNLFYHNNIDSADLLYESSWMPNSWDNGKEGNYWSSYNGTDINADGIGDTVYKFNSDNIDRYPLTQPVDIYSTANPIPNETPTLPPEDRSILHLEPTDYLLPIIIVLIVIIISLLLFRRHRKTAKKPSKQITQTLTEDCSLSLSRRKSIGNIL